MLNNCVNFDVYINTVKSMLLLCAPFSKEPSHYNILNEIYADKNNASPVLVSKLPRISLYSLYCTR